MEFPSASNPNICLDCEQMAGGGVLDDDVACEISESSPLPPPRRKKTAREPRR